MSNHGLCIVTKNIGIFYSYILISNSRINNSSFVFPSDYTLKKTFSFLKIKSRKNVGFFSQR